ncbi:MAG: LamG-like jellyroll fold domain-containing protein [Phycisphaerales bacterium]
MRSAIPIVAGIFAGVATSAVFAVQVPKVEFLFTPVSGMPSLVVNSGSVGAAADGTLGGNAALASGGPFGAGDYLLLDGAGDFVAVPNAFNYGGAATVEAWIRPDAVDGQRVIWDDYGNPGVLMTVFNGTLQWNISTTSNPGPGIGYLVGTISTGVWHHVAGTYDGAFIRAYIDGALVGCAATSGPIQDNGFPPKIGSDNIVTNALNFLGGIDDLRIFDVALAPSELAGGYFATHPPKAGDLDGSGTVDGGDLGLLLSAWGPCPAPACCLADLNGDGVVDGSDLGVLLASWQ